MLLPSDSVVNVHLQKSTRRYLLLRPIRHTHTHIYDNWWLNVLVDCCHQSFLFDIVNTPRQVNVAIATIYCVLLCVLYLLSTITSCLFYEK